MLQFGACPTCGTELDKERFEQGLLVCQACGWSDNQLERNNEHAAEKRFIGLSIVFSAVLTLAFIHMGSWGSHYISIVGLKGKQMAGMASETDLNRIADICLDLKKPKCAIEALTQASRHQMVSQESLFRLGKILWQTQQPAKAIVPLSAYFERGGQELEAAFIFAQTLGQTNNFEKADQYFRFVLDSKPDTLQITVTQAYVEMLKASNQLGRALSLIEEFRKKGENTGLFMDRELKEIQQMLASR